MIARAYAVARVLVGRLARGADLLESLAQLARQHGVRMGWCSFFGAVQRARLAYYDQEARSYRAIELDRPLEIATGVGNVSLLDGDVFVHAHAVLSDAEGRCYAGHLDAGTVVFACEYALFELSGAEPLSRWPDADTGLKLWTGS